MVVFTAILRDSLEQGDGRHVIDQPYAYQRRELTEPDWRRFPGWADVTAAQWESEQWQRAHCVKNIRQLREVAGPGLSEAFLADLEHDQRERATMSMLVPPQMLNTMAPAAGPAAPGFTDVFYADPVRRYMIPAFSDRRADWPSHPYASRDSLHEAEMWAVEGLTHRYPTKVLAEVLPTCPQYCGHCTRMDLVGNPTPTIGKHKFGMPRDDRLAAMIGYLKATPGVRDVVVSGGDVANLPWPRLEANAAQSVTPLVARAARTMLETGIRDVRNQGVLLRGVNDSPGALLDLSFVLLDEAKIMPYYLYMCDMIPGSEHWRLSLGEAQRLQHQIMGYLPGFATPRIVCDVPLRRQALGAPGLPVRRRSGNLLLVQELPDRGRGR